MKRVINAGIVIASLLVASLVAAFLHRSPVAVARDFCARQRFQPVGANGAKKESLTFSGSRGSRGPLGIGNRETVVFRVEGANPPKQVVVELRQRVFFLPWQAQMWTEEPRR